MTVLVTGSTGLLGNNVARILIETGHHVRLLVRQQPDFRPLADLDVDIVTGDIRNQVDVQQAVDGCDWVIHSAGYVQIGWSNSDLHNEINAKGTDHVAAACRHAGVKMVHVSTADTLGIGSWDSPVDERSTFDGHILYPYVVSKRAGEQNVQNHVEKGLNAVIVNPTFMLGPWDWKPSSGRMLLRVAARPTPIAPSGGNNFCDARDVARGILSAAERGQTGRRYILGGHNHSYFDAWKLFAKVTGGRPPRMSAGPLMQLIAGRAGDLWGYLCGKEPEVNSASTAIARLPHYFTCDRAIRELDYQVRPLHQTVSDTWRWFVDQGYA